jgi:aldose 1-epimerase
MMSIKNIFPVSFTLISVTVLNLSCMEKKQNEIILPYSTADFEQVIDGKQTRLHRLENENGMVLTLSNYGARIISVYAPDKNGEFEDVVLGSSSVEDYVRGNAGVGATIGPVANRIANAKFEIDGVVYELPMNNNNVSLHSGPQSFYRQVWDSREIATDQGHSVEMSLFSHDGQWGFPGNKKVNVTYTLTNDNSIIIDYEATTDKACHINMTNHAYFNLKGEGKGNILDHVLMINANSITPFADSILVPSGEIMDVRGTDLDFTRPMRIGERINSSHRQMVLANGYDHNYVLNKDQHKSEMGFCASLYDPESGRYMECHTTEPAVQLYTANFLNGSMMGKRGVPLNKWDGVCLETQHYPDSPNHKNFPNTLLKPGETFTSRTLYTFSVKE